MFISIIAIIWGIRILANISSYIHLWYVKEYRPDRMFIHLRRTAQGKWIYFPKLKLPPLTLKTLTLFIALTSTEILLFISLPYSILVNLLLLDMFLFPLSFVYVTLFRIPTLLYHKYKINQAKKLLIYHHWKSVIGITGSFGKTSTKEFLSTILSSKYSILKTELSKNSAIGISETVLSQLFDQEMFVVEMGAYKIGEIAEMVKLVQPEVGIITAINAQHQDLFGSIENTMKAKYELLFGLTGKRIAIANADNEYSYTMGQWAKSDGCDVWFVTKNKKIHPDALFWIEDIKSDISSCSFILYYKNEKQYIKTGISGEHFIMNIVLAIAGAVASGLTLTEAAKGAIKIQSVAKNMEVLIGKNKEIFINDTFNNNPDAAIAALTYLEKFKKQKILVFQPMIELGNYSDSAHEEVGKKAASVCHEIILTNNNFSNAFIRGVRLTDKNKKVHIYSSNKAALFIKSIIHKDDAVLFKGKDAGFIWKLLQ